jgi:F-box-like
MTLSSVCRHWRSVALSTPQIWSKIGLGVQNKPLILSLFLQRSKPLPLHVFIPSVAGNKQLEMLRSATDRIICLKLANNLRFLQSQFPALERLELHLTFGYYLFQLSQFPQLRELALASNYTPVHLRLSEQQTGFAGLRKLKISCGSVSPWSRIVQSASNTLVSLTLHVVSYCDPPICHFSFPQLRHLQLTKTENGTRLLLNLDAPILESMDEGLGITDDVLIQLRSPSSVKQLRVETLSLLLRPYPALRRLWIDDHTNYDGIITDATLGSLRHQIESCPDLEAIFYRGWSQRRTSWDGEHIPPGAIFTAISDLIRETGRDITVMEFLPTELDLPGAMQRGVGIHLTTITSLA